VARLHPCLIVVSGYASHHRSAIRVVCGSALLRAGGPACSLAASQGARRKTPLHPRSPKGGGGGFVRSKNKQQQQQQQQQ